MQAGVSQGANLLFGILRAKVVALSIGPEGAGVFGQLGGVLNIAGMAAQWGLPTGLVSEVGRARGAEQRKLAAQLRVAFAVTLLVTSTIIAIAVALFARPVAAMLFPGGGFSAYLVWLAPAVVLTTMASACGTLLTADKRLAAVALYSLLSGLGASLATIAGAVALGLDGVVASVAVGGALALGVGWHLCAKSGVDLRGGSWRDFHLGSSARALYGYATVGLVGSIVLQASDIVAKRVLMGVGGLDAAGQAQAGLNLSHQYLGLLVGTIGTFLFPRLAEQSHPDGVARECDSSLRLLLLVGAPPFLLMGAFPETVVTLLYSRQFGGAAGVLSILLIADAVRLVARTLGAAVVAQKLFGSWIAVDLLTAAAVPSVCALTVGTHGPRAIALGHVVGTLLATSVYFAVLRARQRFWLSGHTAWGALALGAALTVSAILASLAPAYVRLLWGGLGAAGVVAILLRRDDLLRARAWLRQTREAHLP